MKYKLWYDDNCCDYFYYPTDRTNDMHVWMKQREEYMWGSDEGEPLEEPQYPSWLKYFPASHVWHLEFDLPEMFQR